MYHVLASSLHQVGWFSDDADARSRHHPITSEPLIANPQMRLDSGFLASSDLRPGNNHFPRLNSDNDCPVLVTNKDLWKCTLESSGFVALLGTRGKIVLVIRLDV